jgi:hypothetical protein
MRLLLINDEIREIIQKVIDFAETNIIEMDDLLDQHLGDRPPVGMLEGYRCDIPVGYRIVYSIERQNPGLVRHLSVSVDTPGRVPNIPAMTEIMKLFGFTQQLEECMVSMEEIGDNHQAINVMALK